MALHQALQSIWVPLKASSFQDNKSPSPSQLLLIRPSSSKNGTSLVCVRAASGDVRSPIINVATVTAGAKLKDVRQKVPSASSTFITSGGFDATSPWEQALADGMIDLGGLELSQERRAEVVEAVRAGAQRGFFYITNFGVESDLVDQVRAASANFFALPAEEKAKVKPTAGWETVAWNVGQGYRSRFSAQGDRLPSFREFFRFTSQPEAMKPVLDFSSLPHAQEFMIRDTFFKYQERMELAIHFMTGVLAEGLGLPPSYIADQYGDTVVNAFFTCSPPHTVRPDSDEKPVPNLTAHYDTNFFDINVAGCGGATSRGLQYFAAGEWHDMPVFRDAALVAIGEDWETVSNGKYHAGLHRVLRNSEAGSRMSFLTTVEAQPDLVLAPAAELIHPHTTTPPKYRSRRRQDRTAKMVKSYNGHTDPERTKTDMVFDADLHLDKSRDVILVGGREFLGGKPMEDL